jgi:hypothetical protein
VKGIEDWSGSVVGSGPIPPVKPGESFTFSGSEDGTNGWTGPAKCKEVQININQESGEDISHTITFEGDGLLVPGAVAAAEDSAVDKPYPSVGLIVKLAAAETAGEDTEIADIRSASLTISSVLSAYASSSTSGAKKRVVGPWDASVSVSLFVNDPADLPVKGLMYAIKLYVNATQYWLIEYGLCQTISGVEVDKETGNLIGATIGFDFSSVIMVSTTPTAGSIEAPGTVTWFPAT